MQARKNRENQQIHRTRKYKPNAVASHLRKRCVLLFTNTRMDDSCKLLRRDSMGRTYHPRTGQCQRVVCHGALVLNLRPCDEILPSGFLLRFCNCGCFLVLYYRSYAFVPAAKNLQSIHSPLRKKHCGMS